MLAVALIYWIAPNIDVPFRFISPGSVAFTAVWLLTAVAFGIYVANFGSYNKTYGTLGGVVVLLTWLYLSNVMLLLGAEINATLAELKDPGRLQVGRQAVMDEAERKRAPNSTAGASPPATRPSTNASPAQRR